MRKNKPYYYFLLSILFTSICLTSWAQPLRYFNGEYTIMDTVSGRAIYAFYDLGNDSIQYQGDFRFDSDLIFKSGAKNVKNISINGNFRRGVKRGRWEYEQSVYDVTLLGIRNFKVESTVDGEQFRIVGNYQNGKPHGRWETHRSIIENSAPVKKSVVSSLQFQNGVATGVFTYKNDEEQYPIVIEGNFNANGYMDGKWKIQYTKDSLNFTEDRKYSGGFLTDILVVSVDSLDNKDTIFDLSLTDVKDQILRLSITPDEVNYKKGERSFGVEFSNGYDSDDERIIAQKSGNRVLKEIFTIFDAKRSIIGVVAEINPPIIMFTRRFQYLYPDEDYELAEIIKERAAAKKSIVDSILELPAVKLNRQRSDSTSMAYVFMQHAHDVLKEIGQVSEKFLNGYFDYLNRDTYFANGIKSLSKPYELQYESGSRTRKYKVEYNTYIKDADSVLQNLELMITEINSKIEFWEQWLSNKISIIQQEKEIQDLDQKIVELLNKVNLIYGGSKQDTLFVSPTDFQTMIKSAASKRSPLQSEIFEVFNNELREEMIRDYAVTEIFDQRLNKGKRIIKITEAMITVFDDLKKIDLMPVELDSAFTIYRENPFFDRMLESRIRTNIYSKGVERLLPEMRREVLRFKNAEELEERVAEILRLRERLKELAKAPNDDEDVKRLDRRLRRENVPERIKRLLGL